MADGAQTDVLGQKAQAAQRAFDARAMSPGKALRRALSRTADVLWDLALVTQDVTLDLLDQDGVIEALIPNTLLVLLDGPDGAVGLACIDREVMTSVIEVQTIQQVTQMPVEDRPLTATDAAMLAPLVDGTLQRMTANLEDHPMAAQLEGYRYGAMLEDARTASLLLEAPVYRCFRAQMDLALGRRRGAMLLILPDREIDAYGDTAQNANAPGPHAERLERVESRLDAVMPKISLPLHAAQRLKPGDLLPLPPDVLNKVEFRAARGAVVAGGRLGQLSGMRAVRLLWPENTQAPAPVEGGMLALDDDGDAADDSYGYAGAPPEMPGLPDMGDADFDGGDAALPEMDQADMAEELPDLPSMDFADDISAFDADLNSDPEAGGEAEEMDFGSFDAASIDFDAAPVEES